MSVKGLIFAYLGAYKVESKKGRREERGRRGLQSTPLFRFILGILECIYFKIVEGNQLKKKM